MQSCPNHLIYADIEKYPFIDFNELKSVNPLKANAIEKKIKDLGVPPAWKNLKISPEDNTHILVFGRDEKNRRQYIYNDDWLNYRANLKWNTLYDFSQHLPEFRNLLEKKLNKKRWVKDKVISLALTIMDASYIRVGNDYYKNKNGTFGLCTLRRKHIKLEDDKLVFKYKGKSNQIRSIKFSNARLIKLIKQCSELRGYELFMYRDENNKNVYNQLKSDDLNEFIQINMREDFSTKFFRTWGANHLTIENYFLNIRKANDLSPVRFKNMIVKKVAKQLGNTAKVCKDYYIHPNILDSLNSDKLYKNYKHLKELKTRKSYKKQMDVYEHIAMDIIK